MEAISYGPAQGHRDIATKAIEFVNDLHSAGAFMKVYVTRNSVAAGDDVDAPHAREFTFPDDSSTSDILNKIVKSGFLARIAGGHAAWVVISHIPIAVVAQQWTGARMLRLLAKAQGQTDLTNGEMRLYFEYHDQADPEAIYSRLQLLARMEF